MNIRNRGLQDYKSIWSQMKEFTLNRDGHSEDELWLLEHHPVYTQGQAGKAEHILNTSAIEVVQSDRGGQVTYHGPGQLVAYILMDLRRANLGIRTLVCRLEQLIISALAEYDITAQTRCGAPGVYVGDKKIASIGLRVKNGCTYHGIALNVNMDLKPFLNINPCGFAKLEMTQIADFHPKVQMDEVGHLLMQKFLTQFK